MQYVTKFEDTDNNIQIGNNWYYLDDNTRNFARKVGIKTGSEVEFNTIVKEGKKYIGKFTKWNTIIIEKQEVNFVRNTSYQEEQNIRNFKIETEWAYKLAVPLAVAEYTLSKKEYDQQEFLDKVEAYQDYMLQRLNDKVNRGFNNEYEKV